MKSNMTKLVLYNHYILCQHSWPTSMFNENFDTEFSGSMNWPHKLFMEKKCKVESIFLLMQNTFQSTISVAFSKEFYWLKQQASISSRIFFCKLMWYLHRFKNWHRSLWLPKETTHLFHDLFSSPSFVAAQAFMKLGTKAHQVKCIQEKKIKEKIYYSTVTLQVLRIVDLWSCWACSLLVSSREILYLLLHLESVTEQKLHSLNFSLSFITVYPPYHL